MTVSPATPGTTRHMPTVPSEVCDMRDHLWYDLCRQQVVSWFFCCCKFFFFFTMYCFFSYFYNLPHDHVIKLPINRPILLLCTKVQWSQGQVVNCLSNLYSSDSPLWGGPTESLSLQLWNKCGLVSSVKMTWSYLYVVCIDHLFLFFFFFFVLFY